MKNLLLPHELQKYESLFQNLPIIYNSQNLLIYQNDIQNNIVFSNNKINIISNHDTQIVFDVSLDTEVINIKSFINFNKNWQLRLHDNTDYELVSQHLLYN